MSNKNILDRLSSSLECSNDTELTELLGVARTTLSSWRSKSSIPIDKLSEIAKKYDLSLDYLVFNKPQVTKTEITPIDEELIFEIESCLKSKDSGLKLVTNYDAFKSPVIFIYNQVCSISNKEERLSKITEFMLIYSQAITITALNNMENVVIKDKQNTEQLDTTMDGLRKRVNNLNEDIHNIREKNLEVKNS